MVPSKANEDFLVAKAHAKINLHLEVLGLRSDGFHELAMVMQSVNLSDQLKLIKRTDNNIILKSNNKEISNGADNLIIKAAKLLRNKVENPEFRTHQKDPLKFHPNEVARFAKDILRIKEVTVEVFNSPSSAAQNILSQILDELKIIRSLLEKNN